MTRRVQADPDCDACRGRGETYDWVDYGSTRAQLPSLCDCIAEQLTEEEAESGDYEIETRAWDGPDEPDLPNEDQYISEARMIYDDFLEARYEEANETGYGDWY